MSQVMHKDSLAETVDAVSDAHFWGRKLTVKDRKAAAAMIAGRQGESGGYRRALPAPTGKDLAQGVKLFTGERITSWASTAHILGEEAYRALLLLDVSNSKIQGAMARAVDGMSECLGGAMTSERWKTRPGEYCCGKCSLSIWRCMAVGGYKDLSPSRWLKVGMKTVNAGRTGDGQWKRFPFYYAALTLTEIGSPTALTELLYAAPRLERILKRSERDDKYDVRRREIAERALAAV